MNWFQSMTFKPIPVFTIIKPVFICHSTTGIVGQGLASTFFVLDIPEAFHDTQLLILLNCNAIPIFRSHLKSTISTRPNCLCLTWVFPLNETTFSNLVVSFPEVSLNWSAGNTIVKGWSRDTNLFSEK